MRVLSWLPLLLAAATIPWTAAAQTTGTTRPLTYVNSVGDVIQEETPITGKIHLHGSAEITTGDYFRGEFDGVPEDGDWAFSPNFGITIELADVATFGADTNLTLGMENGLSDDEPFDNVGHPSLWYEANPYAGLTFRLANNAMAGITYTIQSAPNDIDDTFQELALTASYAGSDIFGAFQPAFKLAVPVHGRSGMYVEAAVRPDLEQLIGTRMPVRTFVPITFGAGFNEYYKNELDMYVSAGLAASMPLNVSTAYGSWSLDGSLNLILREDSIKDIGDRYDNAGNSVFLATLGVKFIY